MRHRRIYRQVMFYVVYLIAVFSFGFLTLANARGDRRHRLFGIATVILGCGEACYLIPYLYALLTDSMEACAAALRIGTLANSVALTVFYVLLYHYWRSHYHIDGKQLLTIAVYVLALVRITLCLFPQTGWLNANVPLIWHFFSIIPHAVLGFLLVILFLVAPGRRQDKAFCRAWIAILLSLVCYILVILRADTIPMIELLAYPKMLYHVRLISMGSRRFPIGSARVTR